TSKSATVSVNGDTNVEADETFGVILSAPANASAGDMLAQGKITNDDVAVPEMNVTGNGPNIADGDTTPDLADHTHFGSANVTGGTVTHTFTIENAGTANLNINSPQVMGPNSSAFSLSAPGFSFTIAPGASTSFDVSFDPSGPDLRSAMISIDNNDVDENPYS